MIWHAFLLLATLGQSGVHQRDTAQGVLTIVAGPHTTHVPITANRVAQGRAIRADLVANALGGNVRHRTDGHYVVTLPGVALDVTDLARFAKTSSSDVVPLPASPYVRGGILYFPFAIITDVVPRVATGVIYDSSRTELRLFVALPPGSKHHKSAATTSSAQRESDNHPAIDARGTPPDSSGDVLVGDGADAGDTVTAPSRHHHLVVVDAGHGGPDHGMRGPIDPSAPQIQEKDITLAVALKTGTALRARGIDVVETRTRDTLIALDDRGRIANAHHADLFISIHVNAANPGWKDPAGSRGFETYFLAEAKTEDARRVEQMENDATRFEHKTSSSSENDPINFITKDMEQNEHLRQSSTLASVIQRHLADISPGPNRGVKQAGFRVLVTTDMPAVLVEIGFGTNAAEARYLSRPASQRRIAEAIASAAAEYFAHYDTHAVASSAP